VAAVGKARDPKRRWLDQLGRMRARELAAREKFLAAIEGASIEEVRELLRLYDRDDPALDWCSDAHLDALLRGCARALEVHAGQYAPEKPEGSDGE
jgi:hypothetical protein